MSYFYSYLLQPFLAILSSLKGSAPILGEYFQDKRIARVVAAESRGCAAEKVKSPSPPLSPSSIIKD